MVYITLKSSHIILTQYIELLAYKESRNDDPNNPIECVCLYREIVDMVLQLVHSTEVHSDW